MSDKHICTSHKYLPCAVCVEEAMQARIEELESLFEKLESLSIDFDNATTITEVYRYIEDYRDAFKEKS